MQPDREIHTTTFTAPSMRAAKGRLEYDLDTCVVVESHPVSKGFHNWAAKFARAWGTMLENEDGTVFVEVTRGRRVPSKTDALKVLTRTPTIRAWLVEHDPKALAQAEAALGTND